MARVRVPARTASRARDELWKHTCFEAFFGPADAPTPDAPYVEVNVSPSSEWAVYRFDRYRQGMRAAQLAEAPRVEIEPEPGLLRVVLTLALRELLAALSSSPGAPLRLALAGVLEHEDGTHSYWAFRHAPDRPDFHHPAGFALEV